MTIMSTISMIFSIDITTNIVMILIFFIIVANIVKKNLDKDGSGWLTQIYEPIDNASGGSWAQSNLSAWVGISTLTSTSPCAETTLTLTSDSVNASFSGSVDLATPAVQVRPVQTGKLIYLLGPSVCPHRTFGLPQEGKRPHKGFNKPWFLKSPLSWAFQSDCKH